MRGSKFSKNIKFLVESCKITWLQFSTRTSIHGVRYISDSKGTFFTRFLWICITVICITTANTLVKTFWTRYKSNPTRMNVETNHGPLQQVPFPAVTFCSTNLISFNRAGKFVDTLVLPENVTQEEVVDMLRQAVGFSHRIEYDMDELERLQNIFNFNRYTIDTAMEQMKLTCRELLIKCRWEGKIIDCMKLFQKSITYDGYCCSFNIAPYNKEGFLGKQPKLFGIGNGLSIILKPNIDVEAQAKIYSEGVQMIIHESSTYPSDSTIEKLLPLQSESLVSVQTTVTFCSTQVKALSISNRGCVFPEEYSLRYFEGYREINCDVECRMKKTMELCDCLPYYYPNFNNFAICNFTRIDCLVDNYYLLHENKNLNKSLNCDCPANCNGIFYDVHTGSGPLILSNYTFDPFYNGVNISHMIVHIYMENQVYKRMRRDLLTNIIGLVANFGGVYSLFLGLSVVGLLEVLYFLLIRLYKNYKIIKKTGITQKQNKKLLTPEYGLIFKNTSKKINFRSKIEIPNQI